VLIAINFFVRLLYNNIFNWREKNLELKLKLQELEKPYGGAMNYEVSWRI